MDVAAPSPMQSSAESGYPDKKGKFTSFSEKHKNSQLPSKAYEASHSACPTNKDTFRREGEGLMSGHFLEKTKGVEGLYLQSVGASCLALLKHSYALSQARHRFSYRILSSSSFTLVSRSGNSMLAGVGISISSGFLRYRACTYAIIPNACHAFRWEGSNVMTLSKHFIAF